LVVNPLLLGPRLAYQAQLYERFRFNRLRIRYIQAATTLNAGSIIGYYDPDPVDGSPPDVIGIQNASEHAGSHPSSFWKDSMWDMPAKKHADPYWIEQDGATSADVRNAQQAVFRLLIETPSADAPYVPGQLHVDFDVTFSDPKSVLTPSVADAFYGTTAGNVEDGGAFLSSDVALITDYAQPLTGSGAFTQMPVPLSPGFWSWMWTVPVGTWQWSFSANLTTVGNTFSEFTITVHSAGLTGDNSLVSTFAATGPTAGTATTVGIFTTTTPGTTAVVMAYTGTFTDDSVITVNAWESIFSAVPPDFPNAFFLYRAPATPRTKRLDMLERMLRIHAPDFDDDEVIVPRGKLPSIAPRVPPPVSERKVQASLMIPVPSPARAAPAPTLGPGGATSSAASKVRAGLVTPPPSPA